LMRQSAATPCLLELLLVIANQIADEDVGV
jgi:hypothetical protein